jgi:hypothetical protein
MRQFVKKSPDGRVALVTTNGRTPVVAIGETLIETTDDPVQNGTDVEIVDGAVVRTARPAAVVSWEIDAVPGP